MAAPLSEKLLPSRTARLLLPLPGADIWECANRKASSKGPGSNTINLSLTRALVVAITDKTQVHQTKDSIEQRGALS